MTKMLKFIRFFVFFGLFGLGAYLLVKKSSEDHSIARSERKSQPEKGELLKTAVVSTTDSNLRPEQSDETSEKLISNYLATSGGKSAYENLKNITASGTFIEAGKSKSFELIETRDGKRRLTCSWRHLGRDCKMIYSFAQIVS